MVQFPDTLIFGEWVLKYLYHNSKIINRNEKHDQCCRVWIFDHVGLDGIHRTILYSMLAAYRGWGRFTVGAASDDCTHQEEHSIHHECCCNLAPEVLNSELIFLTCVTDVFVNLWEPYVEIPEGNWTDQQSNDLLHLPRDISPARTSILQLFQLTIMEICNSIRYQRAYI